MSSHKKRFDQLAWTAVPPKGTSAYDAFAKKMEKLELEHPEIKKIAKDQFNRVVEIVSAQYENGAGLPLDQELRYFQLEYNNRTIEFGLRLMPSSFNVIESFFSYEKENYFKILEEDNYLISLYDYIDFITAADFKDDKVLIEDNFVDDLIYHFDILNDLEKLTFSSNDGEKYVIGGISMIKRGTECTVFILSGLECDTLLESKKLSMDDYKKAKGKEEIVADPNRVLEAVKLFNKDNYWKTLAYCRIDLEKMTIDERYVQKDIGVGYETITDNISVFLNPKGQFMHPELEDYYQNSLKKIEKYTSLFDLAAKCLYLPYYLNVYDDFIVQETHETKLNNRHERKGAFKKKIPIPAEFIIKYRTVHCLDRNIQSGNNQLEIDTGNFKIERDGYWKPIEYNSIGKDKTGKPIHHKTWVNKVISYYEANNSKLIVATKTENPLQSLPNYGLIYIMHNPSHAIDIFKIGLTTRTSTERAKDLSATSGAVDKFLVSREWPVKDCILAEKLIHAELDKFRLNEKREFFKVDYANAISVIDIIINKINGQSPSIK